MKEYENNIYNFQVSYPDHWEYIEKTYKGKDIIYFYCNNIKDGVPNINLSVFYNQEADILEIVKATKQEIRNYLRRIKIMESNITEDQKGILVYEGEWEGARYHFKQVILKREAETLSFTATCKLEVLQVYRKEMEEVLQSVHFKEK